MARDAAMRRMFRPRAERDEARRLAIDVHEQARCPAPPREPAEVRAVALAPIPSAREGPRLGTRAGEVSVSDLLRQLEVEPSTASQQLAVLRIRGIVESRREGNNVFYRLRDPSVGDLLDVARRMFNNHVVDLQQLLVAQEQEDRLVARQPRRGASRGAVGARS